ncbi:hypothetical protein BH10PSE3_BH10PSE3_17330 [soil metagenome]
MSKSIEATYDRQVDAAYISLKKVDPGGVAKTYTCDIDEVGGVINLDFDQKGQLVGIEILDAFTLLPADFFS